MTQTSDRYRRLSDAFAQKLAAVEPNQWDATTPCDEWTVKDLVAHVVETQGIFEGLVGREIGEVPPVDDAPVDAWNATRAVVQGHLDDPDAAGAEFDGFDGRSTFESGVDRFLNTDLVLHGWDLAHATGQDETIASEDIDHVRRVSEGLADKIRGPGAFGPEIEPAPDADEQTRLLNFVGRET